MGAKFFAFITVISVLILCRFNTVAVNRRIDEIVAEVEASKNGDSAKAAREKYQKYERLISITVSHEDLMLIGDLFAQYESEATDNYPDAKITKSRLLSAFEHLRRLCNLNVDSVL